MARCRWLELGSGFLLDGSGGPAAVSGPAAPWCGAWGWAQPLVAPPELHPLLWCCAGGARGGLTVNPMRALSSGAKFLTFGPWRGGVGWGGGGMCCVRAPFCLHHPLTMKTAPAKRCTPWHAAWPPLLSPSGPDGAWGHPHNTPLFFLPPFVPLDLTSSKKPPSPRLLFFSLTSTRFASPPLPPSSPSPSLPLSGGKKGHCAND